MPFSRCLGSIRRNPAGSVHRARHADVRLRQADDARQGSPSRRLRRQRGHGPHRGPARRRTCRATVWPARSIVDGLPLEDRDVGASVGGRRAARVLPAALPADAAHHRAGTHSRRGRGAQRRATGQPVVRGRMGVRTACAPCVRHQPGRRGRIPSARRDRRPHSAGISAVARSAGASGPRPTAQSTCCFSGTRPHAGTRSLPGTPISSAPSTATSSFSEVDRPRLSTTPGYRSGDERLALVASSRILLCVHSTERPYFEQHRAMLALANGCLLVTESSQHTEPLQDGVHFASAELDALPALCRRYLTDPSALEKVASAGREMAIAHMPLRRSSAIVLDTLQRPRRRDVERRSRRRGLERRSGDAWRTVGLAWPPATRRGRPSPIPCYDAGRDARRHRARHAVQLPAARHAVPRQRHGSDAARRRSRDRGRRRRVVGRRRRSG